MNYKLSLQLIITKLSQSHAANQNYEITNAYGTRTIREYIGSMHCPESAIDIATIIPSIELPGVVSCLSAYH